MFNKVVLVGNLTRDIELRYTPSGMTIGSSAIAVTRRFSGSNGEKKEETCFIDISFFGRTAEVANQYLSKGSKILVEGRLRLEQWSDQNGQNRSKHSVVVESMEMLGSVAQKSNQSLNPYSQQSSYPNSKQYQNQNSYQNSYQQEEKIKEIDISDFDMDDGKSELPF